MFEKLLLLLSFLLVFLHLISSLSLSLSHPLPSLSLYNLWATSLPLFLSFAKQCPKLANNKTYSSLIIF